MVIVTVIQ